ncbi:MAG: MTAP family purine nucleoside phosphorylase [Methanobacteriota archaeon]|nr:MAG: MTAP family purine nucleoside phosphorylase [Euryarchaeota archaeon]
MIGVIGGSGLASPTLLTEPRDTFTVTPHGAPSGPVVRARHGDVKVTFVARHGPGHKIPPHRVNHRANLWALKEAGADRILATSSVGSLKIAIRPGTFVVPHDYVAFWNIPTFYDEEVRHVTPSIDDGLRKALLAAAKTAKARAAPKGVYVQATGPRLETKAEIAFFKTVGDVVGMTVASEATLAAELGIPYAALCSVDNYCHGLTPRPVTFREIQEMQKKNAAASEAILAAALEALR